MSKPKKKIVRPQYVAKELRIKKAPKKPVPKELKWGILFCAVALVLAVVLFLVLYDDGSLPMQDGSPVMEGNNWLIANTGTSTSPKYYKIGEVDGLAGYTLDPEGIDSSGLRVYTYRPDDPDSQVNHYYVTGINMAANVNAESINANYKAWMSNMQVSDVQTVTINGLQIDYFITEDMPATGEEDTAQTEAAATTQQLICYMPAVRNTSVLMAIVVNTSPEQPAWPTEDLLAMLEDIVGTITLEAK